MISNFISGVRAELRLADAVFQVSIKTGNDRVVRPFGHAGLVAVAKSLHGLEEEVVVYHMSSFVEKDRWADGVSEDMSASPRLIKCCVDVAGSLQSIEDAQRDDIIRTALGFFATRPSKLAERPHSCFWLGPADASGHPLHPSAENAYAFSCATYVHHCYERAGKALVQTADLPFIEDDERRTFEEQRLPIFAGPFRRLGCGHLICAFEADPKIPFKPESGDWRPCKDAVLFARLLSFPRS
jgi:hypothetical protein